MTILISILLGLPIGYLAAAALYQLILAMASRGYSSPTLGEKASGKTLILVPAYQEDAVILSSTKANLKRIPAETECDYLIVADKLSHTTVAELKSLGAEVLEVAFEKSTKVKSLKAAIAHVADRGGYAHTIILDADNHLNPNFISVALRYRALGHRTIQGERLAANTRNAMEILDGLSEKANQEMLCKGANQLGLSSKLTGSAMVLDFGLFVEVLPQLHAIGGFDKEMELLLTSMREAIHYAPELQVWDEKVSSHEAFAKQRGRWLESQYTFLRKSFGPALEALGHGNVDYFHKSIQLALPPRVLTPVALSLFFVLSLILGSSILAWAAGVAWVALMSSYLLVLPGSLWKKDLGKILLALPGLVIAALKALRWMKKSKKEFLHTTHTLAKP
jgi:cellulose synthase/poly-beta-1,6-N-acetylglucosamine synthase-like glycosyltransferase